jgi:hypothetical protein
MLSLEIVPHPRQIAAPPRVRDVFTKIQTPLPSLKYYSVIQKCLVCGLDFESSKSELIERIQSCCATSYHDKASEFVFDHEICKVTKSQCKG